MPIRPRQKLPRFGAYSVIIQEVKTNEATGLAELVDVDQSDMVLPDTETTDLRLLLKAGVNLKQVNTQILPSKGIAVALDNEEDIVNTTKENEDA